MNWCAHLISVQDQSVVEKEYILKKYSTIGLKLIEKYFFWVMVEKDRKIISGFVMLMN